MVTNVILIALDKTEQPMPIVHITEQLPKFIQLISFNDKTVRYYEMWGLLIGGKPVYHQLLHKPSEPFVQA